MTAGYLILTVVSAIALSLLLLTLYRRLRNKSKSRNSNNSGSQTYKPLSRNDFDAMISGVFDDDDNVSDDDDDGDIENGLNSYDIQSVGVDGRSGGGVEIELPSWTTNSGIKNSSSGNRKKLSPRNNTNVKMKLNFDDDDVKRTPQASKPNNPKISPHASDDEDGIF